MADIVLVNKSLEFLGDGDQYYALLETWGGLFPMAYMG